MSISIENIMAQVKADYGYRLRVHSGENGLLMVGCGHIVTERDRLHLGNRITQDRCDALLAHDLDVAICACMAQMAGFDDMPDVEQEVIVKAAFRFGIASVLAGQPSAPIAIEEESHND